MYSFKTDITEQTPTLVQ